MIEKLLDAALQSTVAIAAFSVTVVISYFFRKPITAWILAKSENTKLKEMEQESIDTRTSVRDEIKDMNTTMQTIGSKMELFKNLHERNDREHGEFREVNRKQDWKITRVETQVETLKESG